MFALGFSWRQRARTVCLAEALDDCSKAVGRLAGRGALTALFAAAAVACAPHHVRSTSGSQLAPPAAHASVSTLETRDARLASALLALQVRPTSDAEDRVALRYLELGILDAASDHFTRAAALNRADAVAYEGLARIWRDWGFPGLGLGDATRAVYYAPEWPAAHNTLGTILTALGRTADARRAYERALALDPLAAYVMSNLCYVSLLDGLPEKALDECRAALAIDPDLRAARDNAARALAGSHP